MSLGQFWNRKAKPLAKVPRYTALVGAEMTPERVSRIRARYTRPWSETSLTDALWRQVRKRSDTLFYAFIRRWFCPACGYQLSIYDYIICPECREMLP